MSERTAQGLTIGGAIGCGTAALKDNVPSDPAMVD